MYLHLTIILFVQPIHASADHPPSFFLKDENLNSCRLGQNCMQIEKSQGNCRRGLNKIAEWLQEFLFQIIVEWVRKTSLSSNF